MKNFYKTFITIGIWSFCLFTFTVAQAQSNQQITDNRIELITTNFSVALQSPNQGVAESALYHSILFQIQMTEMSDKRIKDGVRKLYKNNRNERIRHKAYLVNTLLENPEIIQKLSVENIQSEIDFYQSITNLLNTHFLVTADAE